MRAEKAVWYRPAYGYAAAVVCVAIAAWDAPSPPRALSFRQAIDQTDRDTQLPLERLAIGSANMLASTSQPQPQSQQHPATLPSQPDRSVNTSARGWPKQPHIGFAKLRTLRLEPGVRGYYRKIEDWKNWT